MFIKGKIFRIVMIMLAVYGCAAANRHPRDTFPAVLTEASDCTGSLEASIKQMTGIAHIRLSPDVFRNNASLLLSNYVPDELRKGRPQAFTPAADKRFMLQIKGDTCILSLVDENMNLITSTTLDTCQCEKLE